MKTARIKQGGLFRAGQVVITTIRKNGEEGESKVYQVVGKVKIESMDDRYILHFTSRSGGSAGFTSRGTVSGRVYTRTQNIVVDEYEEIKE